MRVFGAPVGYLVDGGGWGDMTLTAAAARAGVRHMSTELAGGGQVTPAALRIAEGGVRRVLHALGVLTREPPRAEHTTRLMQLSGQDYYCYAPEPGLFEPLVELGAEVEAAPRRAPFIRTTRPGASRRSPASAGPAPLTASAF